MSVLHDATRRSRLATGWGQLELPLTLPRVTRPLGRDLSAPPILRGRPLRSTPPVPTPKPPAPAAAAEAVDDGR
jgi:hypothetical protein